MSGSRRIKTQVAVVLGAMMVSAPAAAEQGRSAPVAQAAPEQLYTFDIPAGPLSDALSQFFRQTGTQLLAPKLPDVKTQGVKGRMTATAALHSLLQGTGLVITVAHPGPPASYRLEFAKPKPTPAKPQAGKRPATDRNTDSHR